MRFENTTEDAQTACFGVELFSNPRKSETAVAPAVKIHPKLGIGLQVRSPCRRFVQTKVLGKKLNRLSFREPSKAITRWAKSPPASSTASLARLHTARRIDDFFAAARRRVGTGTTTEAIWIFPSLQPSASLANSDSRCESARAALSQRPSGTRHKRHGLDLAAGRQACRPLDRKREMRRSLTGLQGGEALVELPVSHSQPMV